MTYTSPSTEAAEQAAIARLRDRAGGDQHRGEAVEVRAVEDLRTRSATSCCGACGLEEHGDNEVCDLDDEAIEVLALLDKAIELRPTGMAANDIARLSGVPMSVLSQRLLGDSVRGVDGLLLRAGLVERVTNGVVVRYRRRAVECEHGTCAEECAMVRERSVAGTGFPIPWCPVHVVVDVERETPTSSWWIVRVNGLFAGCFVRIDGRCWRATKARADVDRAVQSERFTTRKAAIAHITGRP